MSAPFLMPASADLLDVARTRHMRQQLIAAIDHGTALLAALGLPRLVTADFVSIDPAEAGQAIDEAIAALDALDAPDEDLEEVGDVEPSLGWTDHIYQTTFNIGGASDREHDTADYEEDDPAESTSLETFGRGFVRAGADDEEEDDPAEDSDPGENDWLDAPADEDGLAEQFAGSGMIAFLPFSIGGYVA